MKKIYWLIGTIVLMVAITACSGAADAPEIGEELQAESGEQVGEVETRPVFADGELPITMQLQLGTFELEGTEYAIDSEQASLLLPLWKAFRSLSSSDTTAAVEIDALLDQIQGAMTSAQLKYITTFEFSQESMFTLMEELGVTPGGFGGEDDRPEGFNPRDGFPGGQFPGGGPGGGPGGEGGPGGLFGQELDPEQQATMEAFRESRGGANNRFASFLIDPLIEYLEGIASGE